MNISILLVVFIVFRAFGEFSWKPYMLKLQKGYSEYVNKTFRLPKEIVESLEKLRLKTIFH